VEDMCYERRRAEACVDFVFVDENFAHDCVSIRKALQAVSQMRDGRVGDDRRGFPRYSYS
jgi:hypothetical protein